VVIDTRIGGIHCFLYLQAFYMDRSRKVVIQENAMINIQFEEERTGKNLSHVSPKIYSTVGYSL